MVAQGTDLRGRFADTLLVATCHREAIDEGRTSLYARSGTFHGADLGDVLVVGGKIGFRQAALRDVCSFQLNLQCGLEHRSLISRYRVVSIVGSARECYHG
jgi:hypothetical protein